MNRLTPTIASRLEFFVLDSTTYLPVVSLGYADVSSSGYVLRSLNGKRTSSTSVSLSSNAALTADVTAGQFVTIDSARGHYAIDCPSGAANVAYDFTEAAVAFTAGHIVRPVVHEIENKIDTALASYDGDGVATESTLSYTAVEANGANTLASLIYAVVQLTDASVSTMATDTRDAILNRVLAGNHTTSGTVGLLLQFLDALVSSRLAPAVAGRTLDVSASGAVTAVLDSAAFTEIKGAGWDSSTDTLEKIRDAISLVSSISVVIPSPVEEIIGMPETLEIGDSYDGDTSIKLYVRDENDDPVTSFAGHDLTDGDFAPTFTIAPTPGSARGRVVGTVTWIPASGPDEGYLKVEIPSLQSRRAVEGESSVQCVLKWDGYEKSILTTTVRWLPRI